MKRNHIKAILVFMLALVLGISQMGAAFAAEGLVEFDWDADAKEYHITFTGNTFDDGTNYSMTDLFPDLKEVIPGDHLTQKVVITNKSHEAIRVYMDTAPSVYDENNYGNWEENSIETNDKHKQLHILDYMKMTVDLVEGKRVIKTQYEPALLSKPVYLATLGRNGEVELEVTLDVNIEMPSSKIIDGELVEYMDAMATIPLTFLVEELPDDVTPDTGDWFSMPVWIGVGAVLAAALLWLLLGWKKRKEA